MQRLEQDLAIQSKNELAILKNKKEKSCVREKLGSEQSFYKNKREIFISISFSIRHSNDPILPINTHTKKVTLSHLLVGVD